uniref:GLOBIN domain-containing protein n=1 Tax=Strongyloides venezuelensis TaxID=75913 RepID=A0A0K0FVS7_STRVS
MRIMEAIQRKKLIQMLNVEYAQDLENEANHSFAESRKLSNMGSINKSSCSLKGSNIDGESLLSPYHSPIHSTFDPVRDKNKIELIQFTGSLERKLSDLQKKALKITWKRLSEAPRTSSKGMLFIMQRVFDLLIERNSEISTVFYRCAFLSCLEDRKKIVTSQNKNSDTKKCPYKLKTIATIRDHANILLDFVNSVICLMFDIPYQESTYIGLSSLGCAHSQLMQLGFQQQWFHHLGECFAEVMFSQECVRAFPHAASAWSLFAVTFTDKLYVESRWRKNKPKTKLPTSYSLSAIPSPSDDVILDKNKKYSVPAKGRVNYKHQVPEEKNFNKK